MFAALMVRVALLWALAGLAQAAGGMAQATLRLDAPLGPAQPAAAWVLAGAGTEEGIEAIAAAGRAGWRPLNHDESQPLARHQPLWLHLRLTAGGEIGPAQAAAGWQLEFPSVVIDRYTLYQRDADGRWQAQAAGDRVAWTAWPLPSLRPRFALPLHARDVAAGGADVYVRIDHTVPVRVQPRLVSAADAAAHETRQHVAASLLAGVSLTLLLTCVQMSWTFRDRVYAWYGVYLLFSLLSALCYTGVTQRWLLPEATKLASDAVGIGVLGSYASFVLFAHAMFRSAHGRWFGWISGAIVGLCVLGMGVLLLSDGVEPRFWRFMVFTAAVFGFVLFAVARAWRKGVRWAGYWLVVYLPFWLAIGLTMAHNLGLLNLMWLPARTPLAASIVEAVAMLWCIHAYSRDSHTRLAREKAAAERDPLTGCLNAREFGREAVRVFEGARRSGGAAAVFLVRVQAQHADDNPMQAEAMLLRSVRLVRSVARDFDTVGRVGPDVLAVAMPGVADGEVFRARLSRLVALGLMVDQHDRHAQAIRFSVAAGNVQGFRGGGVEDLLARLRSLLQDTSADPQGKRIRLLEAASSHPQPARFVVQEGARQVNGG